MAKLIKDLVLAMLNATLLLIAAGLFLAWRTSLVLDGMLASFAGNLEIVAPLRDDVRGLTGEVAALRGDLATLATQGGASGSAGLQAVQTRVTQIEARLQGTGAAIDGLVRDPGQLVDRVIETTLTTAADAFAGAVIDIRGCTSAGS